VLHNKSGATSRVLPYQIPITVRTLLSWCVDIQGTATRAHVTYLATKTDSPQEKKRLEELADSESD